MKDELEEERSSTTPPWLLEQDEEYWKSLEKDAEEQTELGRPKEEIK